MLTLHDNIESGNAYKVRLLLSQLDIDYTSVEYDVTREATRTEDFLDNINPNGRIPVIEFEDGKCLAESNAILYYFAQDTDLFPIDKWKQAQVMKWLFFEQYSHEPYVAVAKYILTMLPLDSSRRGEIPKLLSKGYKALTLMEDQLQNQDFMVGNTYTIADIALFAYTHKAKMGNFDLTRFPAILRWIKRIENRPGFIAMYPEGWTRS